MKLLAMSRQMSFILACVNRLLTGGTKVVCQVCRYGVCWLCQAKRIALVNNICRVLKCVGYGQQAVQTGMLAKKPRIATVFAPTFFLPEAP